MKNKKSQSKPIIVPDTLDIFTLEACMPDLKKDLLSLREAKDSIGLAKAVGDRVTQILIDALPGFDFTSIFIAARLATLDTPWKSVTKKKKTGSAKRSQSRLKSGSNP